MAGNCNLGDEQPIRWVEQLAAAGVPLACHPFVIARELHVVIEPDDERHGHAWTSEQRLAFASRPW